MTTPSTAIPIAVATTWATAIPSARERLDAIDDHLLATGLDAALERREAPLVDAADARAWRTAPLRRRAARRAASGSPTRRPAARARPRHDRRRRHLAARCMRAAGAAVAATDAVIDGAVENAFCAVRPPGHHATRDAGDGLLLLQQRRGRGAPCARRARPGARGDRRLRRPPRQRHRGHHRRRRARADGRASSSTRSTPYSGAVPHGHQHGQRAGAAVHPRRRDPRADRGELDAAARRVQAAR